MITTTPAAIVVVVVVAVVMMMMIIIGSIRIFTGQDETNPIKGVQHIGRAEYESGETG
jgi:NADH:ubiquinone oxidoreductase subunit 3 (subunit A)